MNVSLAGSAEARGLGVAIGLKPDQGREGPGSGRRGSTDVDPRRDEAAGAGADYWMVSVSGVVWEEDPLVPVMVG